MYLKQRPFLAPYPNRAKIDLGSRFFLSKPSKTTQKPYFGKKNKAIP